jgi:hypothetical protein
MLSAKDNLLETLRVGGRPDRLVDQYQPFALLMNDPVRLYTSGNRVKGTTTKDRWGTTIVWPEDQFAAMPHITADDKVLPDITAWRDYVKVPDLAANAVDWSAVHASRDAIDRNEKLIMSFMGTGIFEESHFLMGFEDALVNFFAEPACMHELLQAILEYRLTYAGLLIDNLRPDVILSHDDWGTKHSLFMSPEVWREFLKPLYTRLYARFHEAGIIVMHHADSFLEPIVDDLVDIGVDIWQGALPQNDIARILRQTEGRLTLMGGIDAAIVDRKDAGEAEIRSEVRKACETYGQSGHFIPCLTYGVPGSIYPHVNPIISDEIERYNLEHPMISA